MRKKKDTMDLGKIRTLILEQLDDSGVNLEQIEIIVRKGPVIVIRGEIYSEEIGRIIKQIINETVDAEDIIDELQVSGASVPVDNDEGNDADYSDEDHDIIGTEDISRAIEDGIPYIPPISSSLDGKPGKNRKKRRDTNI